MRCLDGVGVREGEVIFCVPAFSPAFGVGGLLGAVWRIRWHDFMLHTG